MNIYEKIKKQAKIGINVVKDGKIFSRREVKSPFSELVDNPNLTPEQNAAARDQRRNAVLEEIGIELGFSEVEFKEFFGFEYSLKSLRQLKLQSKMRKKRSLGNE